MSAITPENTARILRGQDPIQKLRCRLGWHRWTSWEYDERRDMDYGFIGAAKCYCADCGMPRVEQPYSKSRKK